MISMVIMVIEMENLRDCQISNICIYTARCFCLNRRNITSRIKLCASSFSFFVNHETIKHRWSFLLHDAKHLEGDFSDFPLGMLVTPKVEYLPQLTEIGGYNNLTLDGIGQHKPRIFVLDAKFLEFGINNFTLLVAVLCIV